MNGGICLKSTSLCEKGCFRNECTKCKLANPILNSTLRHKSDMQHLHETKHIPLNKPEGVSKKTKLKKLNFGAHQKIFGDLTPINVNDSLLLPKAKELLPKKYMECCDKITTPDLHDFLEELPSLIYVIPEPTIDIKIIEYEFDVMANCKIFE